MTGDAAQRERPRVVDRTEDHFTVAQPGRGDPFPQRLRRREPGVSHLQRREDVFVGEGVHRHPADPLDQLPEGDEPHVGVTEPGARRGFEFQTGDAFECLRLAVGVVGQGVVGDQSGGVEQELLDGHRLLAPDGERRPVFCHRVARFQLPLLDQEHDRGRRGDRLGQRRQVEDRVRGHWCLLGLHRPLAVRLAENNRVVADDQHHRTGTVAPLDRRRHRLVNPGQVGVWLGTASSSKAGFTAEKDRRGFTAEGAEGAERSKNETE